MDSFTQEYVSPVNQEPLGQVLTTIEDQCCDESDAISLFKDVTTHDYEHPEIQAKFAANAVYDGMMLTLKEIGACAVIKAQNEEPSPMTRAYDTVARNVELMALACRALADDKIPLVRNVHREELKQQNGDQVHIYTARNVTIEGHSYEKIDILIRPTRYEQPLALRRKLKDGKGKPESRQPRMNIELIPTDANEDKISIHVDEEDLLLGNEITYDVQIRNADGINLMDILDFSQHGESLIEPGQRFTHHFSSDLTAGQFKTTFAQILEAFNQKFAGVADAPKNPAS
jgi:hypothetical protein